MLSESEWESLCNQCGKCCYLWSDYLDARGTTESCSLLDKSNNKCTQYEDRFKKKREAYRGKRSCVKLKERDLEMYYETRFLPDDCAYIKYYMED